MPRVLLAPDKFKGTLTAAEVAGHLSTGLRSVLPDVEVVVVPVADGGDGTLAAAVAAGFTRVPVRPRGPTGMPCDSAYGVRGTEAVVELAEVSGLAQLPGAPHRSARGFQPGHRRADRRCPRRGCTSGGRRRSAAAPAPTVGPGCSRPSAPPSARQRQRVDPGGAGLLDATVLDLGGLHPGLAGAELVVACDVDNPLTGSRGAAAVYGPQKGAGPQEVELLDSALTHWADVVARATGQRAPQRTGRRSRGRGRLRCCSPSSARRPDRAPSSSSS